MFVYESLVDFIVGDNVFFISGLLMIAWKISVYNYLVLSESGGLSIFICLQTSV